MRIISTRLKYFTGGHNELRTGQLSTGDPERSCLTRFVCWPAGGWSGPAGDCCQLWDPAQTPPYNTSTAHTLTGWTEVIQDNSNRITSKYHLIYVVHVVSSRKIYFQSHHVKVHISAFLNITINHHHHHLYHGVTWQFYRNCNTGLLMCYVQRKVRFPTKKVL